MLPRKSLTALVLSAFLSAPAAAKKNKGPAAVPDLVHQAEVLGAQNRMEGIALLEEYIAGGTDPRTAPYALVWAGEQRRLGGDLKVARTWFEKAATAHPTHAMKGAAVLGMALVDAEESLSGNTLATLQLQSPQQLPASMNADRYRLLARVAADEGTSANKVRELVKKAVAFAKGDPIVEGRVRVTLHDLLSEDQAGGLAEGEGGSAEEVAVSRIRAALHGGEHADAVRLGQSFLETWADSEVAREVDYMVRRAAAGDPTVAGKVGVLIPMSGDYAAVSTQIKQVIELANRRTGGSLSFSFADSGDSAETVQAAIEKLVLEEGCVAVLGPLRKDVVMPAAETAQAIGVPMVALAQAHQPTEAGDYVFRAFLPLRHQVDALLDQAMGVMGLQRFAIMYPRNGYGEQARDLFAAGVERRGGAMVRVIDYDPAQTDFLEQARFLGQRKKGSDRPAIVDFDAVFIPDGHRRVVLVASAMAYEEIPVGTFRPYRMAEPVPLLGLNGWHNPRIAEAGGQYLQNGIFVDTFWSAAPDGAVRDFVATHTEDLGRAPGVVDALTYDALRLLQAAVVAGGPSREAVRDELGEARLDAAVAGGQSFGDDREVERKLRVLTIKPDGIREWLPPELELPPEGLPSDN